jgi:hypothetical protein
MYDSKNMIIAVGFGESCDLITYICCVIFLRAFSFGFHKCPLLSVTSSEAPCVGRKFTKWNISTQSGTQTYQHTDDTFLSEKEIG